MSRSDGKTSSFSDQVKQTILKTIKSSPEPLTWRQIIKEIRKTNAPVFNRIHGHCQDYVRILLSQKKVLGAVKYQPKEPIPGCDYRSNYYGYVMKEYPSEKWVMTDSDYNKVLQTFLDSESKILGKGETAQKSITKKQRIELPPIEAIDRLLSDKTYFNLSFHDPFKSFVASTFHRLI